MEELSRAIAMWGRERSINNPQSQFLKLYEEVAEAYQAYTRQEEGLSMELGDIVVVVTILADMLGLDIAECQRMAYDKIKYRKGKTINGNFVKESDL